MFQMTARRPLAVRAALLGTIALVMFFAIAMNEVALWWIDGSATLSGSAPDMMQYHGGDGHLAQAGAYPAMLADLICLLAVFGLGYAFCLTDEVVQSKRIRKYQKDQHDFGQKYSGLQESLPQDDFLPPGSGSERINQAETNLGQHRGDRLLAAEALMLNKRMSRFVVALLGLAIFGFVAADTLSALAAGHVEITITALAGFFLAGGCWAFALGRTE